MRDRSVMFCHTKLSEELDHAAQRTPRRVERFRDRRFTGKHDRLLDFLLTGERLAEDGSVAGDLTGPLALAFFPRGHFSGSWD